jgi:hypothetical protein
VQAEQAGEDAEAKTEAAAPPEARRIHPSRRP